MLNLVLKLLLILTIFLVCLVYLSFTTNVGVGEYQKWYVAEEQQIESDDIKIQFAGVSTLLISDDSAQILTDGFFSQFPMYQMLFGEIEPQKENIQWAMNKMGITELDAILVVHSHFDHAIDAPQVANITGASVYGSESTANISRGWGLPESQIKFIQDGQQLRFGRFTITPILSNHFEFPDPEMKK